MSVLSIFCDESGDFGEDPGHYVLTLVFHEQRNDISAAVEWLNTTLRTNGLDAEHAIHTGPAIRGENEYHNAGIDNRRREFNLLYSFARKVPITFQTFDYLKRQ